MRTVRDTTGKRFVLVKQSSDASRVRDPETGEERYVDNDELSHVDGESPLVTAAAGISPAVRRVLTAVPNERALGLLVELVDRGAVPVVDLLNSYDLCESDLHGLLTEFRAAGLVAETTVFGERGYEATDLASDGVRALRG